MKILIIAPAWVGDMVMAQSLFIALKNTHTKCQIDVLAPLWSQGLLSRMPEVSQTFVMPLTHGQFGLKARFELGKTLRDEKYDQSIVLPNSWKSALIPFFAKIPKRTGFLGECRFGLLNDIRLLDKKHLTMTVQRFVALGYNSESPLSVTYDLPTLHVNESQQKAVIKKFNLVLEKPVLVLCAGAEYGSSKRWPENHFAQLAKQKLEKGWQVWLIGSEKDQKITQAINELCNDACHDFAGKTNLTQAVDLLSLAHTVVTNDSGLMHIAAALDRKVIALYGSSDPHFTPPLHVKAHVISLNLACSPCFKRECPLGHRQCLTDILPHQVIALFER